MLKIHRTEHLGCTVVPQYSAPHWEIVKSVLYQSVHYIEVLCYLVYLII